MSEFGPLDAPAGRVRIEIDTIELTRLDLHEGEILILRVPDKPMYPDGFSFEETRQLHAAIEAALDGEFDNTIVVMPKSIALAVLVPDPPVEGSTAVESET